MHDIIGYYYQWAIMIRGKIWCSLKWGRKNAHIIRIGICNYYYFICDVCACVTRNNTMILRPILAISHGYSRQCNTYYGFRGNSRPDFQDSPTTHQECLLMWPAPWWGVQGGSLYNETLNKINLWLKRRWEPPLSTDRSWFMTRMQQLQSCVCKCLQSAL